MVHVYTFRSGKLNLLTEDMVAVLSLIRSQASLGVGSPGTDTNQYSAIALHQRL